jgi:hypothetical protein
MTQRVKVAVKRRIVPNWKSRIGDYSTKALALGTAAAVAWVALPADLKAFMPTEFVAWAIGALNAFGLVSKFFVQGDPPADKP